MQDFKGVLSRCLGFMITIGCHKKWFCKIKMQDEGNILSHEEKRPWELRGSIFGIYAQSFGHALFFILFLEFEIEVKT